MQKEPRDADLLMFLEYSELEPDRSNAVYRTSSRIT